MEVNHFLNKCKSIVKNYTNDQILNNSSDYILEHNVLVVWVCKTLQNIKAILITDRSDNMFYECTYNGDKDEIYLDAYKKVDNYKYRQNI